MLAAQDKVSDEDVDVRSRQPNLRVDDVLGRDNIVPKLAQNACDELAYCSIRFGEENTCHRLPDLDESLLRISNLVWFKNR